MGLIFWWMLLVWVAGIAGYWGVRYWWRRTHRATLHRTAVPVAHVDRLTKLPAYKAAMQQYRKLLLVATACMTVAVIAGIFLTARPASISLITPAQKSRDIMLCLDVSGSLLRTDAKIVNRFGSLVNNFNGQRVGLTVFNSSAVSIMPLNDDYSLIRERLKTTSTALQTQTGQDFTNLTSGTLAAFDKGTSLVTDGLASCMRNMGQNPEQRPQSIILATDNEMHGKPIITMTQAAVLAKDSRIHVYAIDPGPSDTKANPDDHSALKKLAETTGGAYFTLDDTKIVPDVLTSITEQEAKYSAGLQVVATADRPAPFMYLAVLLTGVSLYLVWRLKL